MNALRCVTLLCCVTLSFTYPMVDASYIYYTLMRAFMVGDLGDVHHVEVVEVNEFCMALDYGAIDGSKRFYA